ncbi:hypothetical protein [Corynebacterium ulceribovis]|uniref:hypothetical protein n=1 Tax=Corynebacterium ulceribovis TaxID=487732 RepID=UPI00037E2ADB|nr:hypothetical protein [Corynebacterium ulceribovis]
MTSYPATKKTGLKTSDPRDYNAEFQDLIDAEFPGLTGRQTPQDFIYRAGGNFEHGYKAIELARRFGVTLMPWQRDQVLLALATDMDDRWLHTDVALICPRQNGKSLILEVIILYRLFVLGHQIVFSAHQWRTAKSIRNRLWRRIKSKRWAEKRIVRNTASAGEAEMETAEGGKLQFTTRSNDMGRGFDCIDLLLLDEAYNLESGELDAVAPTQLAAGDPQTFYSSSAVNETKHPKGEELSRVRHRALSGNADGMMFAEFRAPDGMDRDDPVCWRLANPSFGFKSLVNDKKMRSMRSKLTDVGFEVEMLGYGRWFDVGDTKAVDDIEPIVPLDRWNSLAVAEQVDIGHRVLAVEVAPDADSVAFVAAGQTSRGVHLMHSPHSGEFHADKAVDIIAQFIKANPDPAAVALDKDSPAGVLVDRLLAVGIEPVQLNGGWVAGAYREFRQAVADGTVTHDGHHSWADALAVARERKSKDGKYPAVDRFSGNVSGLIAGTFALWALTKFLAEFGSVAKQVEPKKTNPAGALPRFSTTHMRGGKLYA